MFNIIFKELEKLEVPIVLIQFLTGIIVKVFVRVKSLVAVEPCFQPNKVLH
jgi:hypothetical protein